MATYYTQYQLPQAYTFPVFTEWNPIVSTVQVTNLYTSPVQALPLAILSQQVVTPLCPFTGVIIGTEPIPAIPQTSAVLQGISNNCNLNIDKYKHELNYIEEQIQMGVFNDLTITEINTQKNAETIDKNEAGSIEFYLSLPKELFPSARMFAIDPNSIIDEFCKLGNVNENVPWILDLEFGVPRVPVTRAIAVYDVKFNSIHCKNTPNAIHPGFENCNDDFRQVILFYYDCIVSSWYKGYMYLNRDKNVENFQSWLLIPKQIFGMCWP